MADHLRALPDVAFSAAQLEPPGDLPLVVISSSDQTPDVAASHQELARMSSRGRYVIASNSHHWVQFDEPELVVETIRGVVNASRRPHVSATRSG